MLKNKCPRGSDPQYWSAIDPCCSNGSIQKDKRYWKITMTNDFENDGQYAAVAAHAEEMRLERIKVIMDDAEADQGIRRTF